MEATPQTGDNECRSETWRHRVLALVSNFMNGRYLKKKKKKRKVVIVASDRFHAHTHAPQSLSIWLVMIMPAPPFLHPPPKKQVGHHMSVHSSALTGLRWLYLSDKTHTRTHTYTHQAVTGESEPPLLPDKLSRLIPRTQQAGLFPNKHRRGKGH